MDLAPIFQLSTERGSFTMKRYPSLYTWPINRRTTVLLIEDALQRTEWPRGLYLMTDLDGMTPEQLNLSEALYGQLVARPTECAVLNRPKRIVPRYRLLKELCNRGMNDFDVHRAESAPGDVRFPVFVRYDRFHRANLTPLLRTRTELDDALAHMLMKGERVEELIVVEWLDYKDPDGVYRKYGAQKVGTHQFGRHVQVCTEWCCKRKKSKKELMGREELDYVLEFPHRDLLEPVYEISGHDWARTDYSFFKGRLQVWEVNDNPELGTKWKRNFGRSRSNRRMFPLFIKPMDDVTKHVQPGPPMRFRLTAQDVFRTQRETAQPDVAAAL